MAAKPTLHWTGAVIGAYGSGPAVARWRAATLAPAFHQARKHTSVLNRSWRQERSWQLHLQSAWFWEMVRGINVEAIPDGHSNVRFLVELLIGDPTTSLISARYPVTRFEAVAGGITRADIVARHEDSYG